MLVSPKSEAFRGYEADRSSWQLKRWSSWIGGGLLIAYGYTSAAAVTDSNSKQDKLKSQALASQDVQQRASLVSQMKSERSKGQSFQSASTTGYGLGLAALALAAWLETREPKRPEDAASSVRVSAAPAPDGSPLVALEWRW